jgi:hypothetical protein
LVKAGEAPALDIHDSRIQGLTDMPDPNDPWRDPKTLLAIAGLIIGLAGFLFGIFRHHWGNRESRLDALGKILGPLIRSAQCLSHANRNRRKCEQLKHAYPDPANTPEVVDRVNSLVKEYSESLESSEGHFRDAESEFGSRHFRFPDAISNSIKTALEVLSELGRLVGEGLFDQADLQLAKFRDEYKRITDTARGWRLADPFEGFLKRFRKPAPQNDERPSEFELTQREMDGVLELLYKRLTTQAKSSFVVHPPKKLCHNPEILESDDAIDQLRDSVFSVVFQDGTAKMLSLPELMAFVFNLIVCAQQSAELNAMVQAAQPTGPREFRVSYRFAMDEIMQPEMVKVLLGKITFAEAPSDA